MGSVWITFRRFLTAEEVPRWFGFSILLIYLVGLGSVAQFGIMQARRESMRYIQQGSRYAISLLAERLSELTDKDVPEPKVTRSYQRALREFARNAPTRWLRVVDADRHVIASTNAKEIGTFLEGVGDYSAPPPAHSFSPTLQVQPSDRPGEDGPDLFIRARLSLGAGYRIAYAQPVEQDALIGQPAQTNRQPGDPASSKLEPTTSKTSAVGKTPLYLEALLPLESFGGLSLAGQARTLTIVLVVLGALFVAYRCLREQLRGMSRIADRLQTHRDRLEEELGSLRIADTLDSVTTAWNDLIDLTQRLLEMARRSDANEELSRVLQRSGGGALAEALSAVPDGIVYIVDEIRFEYMNTAACRLLGFSAQEAKQTTLTDAKAEGIGGKILDLLRDASQGDGSFEERTELLEADGPADSYVPADGGPGNVPDRSSYRVRVIPLQRGHRHGECVVLIRDVSQQIRAERAREEFMIQVSHELRTPLTNIRAYTETLSSGMFEDPGVITECYNVITKETRRLSRLVEDILSVSQLEIGTIELQIDNVDLKTLLSEGVRDVRGLADEKNLDIQLALPDKLEPIQADRDKLAVVINNLLGNAIKYTPPDGHVVVGCQFTGGDVVISVKDNGIGIEPADQPRVFEKFQRATDPEVLKQTGTGIGLYTAREIARRHRGDIELISEKGQGSTFLVRLPHTCTRAALSTTREA